MKHFLILILITLITACQAQKKEGVEIKGKLKNSNGQTIVLEHLSTTKITPLDSVKVEKDGEFELNVQIPEMGFYRLSFSPNNFIILALDTVSEVKIEADANNLANSYTVKGSRDSELLWELNNTLKVSAQTRDSLEQIFKANQNSPDVESVRASLEAKYMESVEKTQTYVREFIKKNPESIASLAAIEQLNPQTDFASYKVLHEGLTKAHPESPYVKAYSTRYAEMSKLSEGSPAPDIIMNTPEGNSLSLSSLKGKIVLVDFWASWCKPCRMENPNVVKLYNQYKDKGFEILGVSLDRDKEAWVKAIKEDNLTWKHVSDLGFWNSSVVKQYNISGIPFTVLVDREGNIIAKGLRGAALENKLAELMP